MSLNPLQTYLKLLDSGDILGAEECLIQHLSTIGYGKVIWHLWRFRRFSPLEPIRASLFEKFNNGVELPWNALQLLYYLQEGNCTGEPHKDAALKCPQIFKELCLSLSRSNAGRRQALQMFLVWQGIAETSNKLLLPASTDEDTRLLYDHLTDLDRLLMECGRLNRAENHSLAIVKEKCGRLTWSRILNPSRLVEIYIGPYYFLPLDAKQLENSRLPESFRSPFRLGLQSLINMFLKRGWQILPYLTWSGGLIPQCSPKGRLSFSYHTHGGGQGRWHYKFGYFSNLMQIDLDGYAGFSSLAKADEKDIVAATADFDDKTIATALVEFRHAYIERRVTWRVQSEDASASLGRGRRTIFVPLQDPFDEVSTLAYLPPSEMLDGIANALEPGDLVYVKRHPVDTSGRTSALLKMLASDQRFIIVDSSIHDLFKIADLVVTVNSGVGFEAILAGLPVITCGASDYQLATRVARSTDEILRHMKCCNWPTPAWRNRVVYHYLAKHLFDPSNLEAFEAMLEDRLGELLA